MPGRWLTSPIGQSVSNVSCSSSSCTEGTPGRHQGQRSNTNSHDKAETKLLITLLLLYLNTVASCHRRGQVGHAGLPSSMKEISPKQQLIRTPPLTHPTRPLPCKTPSLDFSAPVSPLQRSHLTSLDSKLAQKVTETFASSAPSSLSPPSPEHKKRDTRQLPHTSMNQWRQRGNPTS